MTHNTDSVYRDEHVACPQCKVGKLWYLSDTQDECDRCGYTMDFVLIPKKTHPQAESMTL